jgi:bifunctional non-homologous end joining protein LigD
MYPAERLTKLDLARYYEAVAPRMVPHVARRPLTLVHCPAGLNGECRYLRHSRVWGPAALRRVRIPEKTKVGEYLVADSAAALVALAQMDVLEIHTWNSTDAALEHPDRIVWDLDPGPQVPWPVTVRAATTLRAVLAVLGLTAWVKTTGGAGLHVVVPVAPVTLWSACLTFARQIAQLLERSSPLVFTTAFARRGREDRILVDYLRNNRTNTTVAAFSTRARPGAPVSVPIAWSELRDRPPAHRVATVLRRLARQKRDPWEDYLSCDQRLTPQMAAAVRLL